MLTAWQLGARRLTWVLLASIGVYSLVWGLSYRFSPFEPQSLAPKQARTEQPPDAQQGLPLILQGRLEPSEVNALKPLALPPLANSSPLVEQPEDILAEDRPPEPLTFDLGPI